MKVVIKMDPVIKAVYCLVLGRWRMDSAGGIPLTSTIRDADANKLRKFMLDYHYHKYLGHGKS
jgi:hypothetical protein